VADSRINPKCAWPFPAGPSHTAAKPDALEVAKQEVIDAADEADPTETYCLCDNELTLAELDNGKCAHCGKPLL
jgi:hypothetical protein